MENHYDWALREARLVATHLPDSISADDLTGAAMIALVRAADRFDPSRGIKFRTFAGPSVRGACYQAMRGRQYREGEHEELPVEMVDVEPNPEERAITGNLGRVWKLVLLLSPMQRAVICRLFANGDTPAELAREWGCSGARIYQIKAQALETLRVLARRRR